MRNSLLLASLYWGAAILGCNSQPASNPGTPAVRHATEDVMGKFAGVRGNAVLVDVLASPGSSKPSTISIPLAPDTRIMVDGEKSPITKIEKGRDVLVLREVNGFALDVSTLNLPAPRR